MEMLKVKGKDIVTAGGKKVLLRGTCIGGWMNMENFIDGYPGTESGLRTAVAKALGKGKAEFFFDRLLAHFFNEKDLRFIKSLGGNAVRLPLNYRHFESDEKPFVYLEEGFKRLEAAIALCERQGIYAILDLHAVQGWQNAHWHSDNSRGHALFWHDATYQDRFVALWEELARRFKGRAAVAGYNVMNEPCTNVPDGDYPFTFYEGYEADWERMHRVYRRVVAAIRKIDPDHIVFLEGDRYSHDFDGLEAPFTDNLAYSSHNYNAAGFGPGAYPGEFRTHRLDRTFENGYWDRKMQVEIFKTHQGTVYAEKHGVPLWVGEFGSQYNGPAAEVPSRLKAMDDQLDVFNEFGAHWTTWTYKDVGVMGWVTLDPESEYMKLIAPIQEMKKTLGAENFTFRHAASPAKKLTDDLAALMERSVGVGRLNHVSNTLCLNQAALTGYAAGLLLPFYAEKFKGMSEEKLDDVLASFEVKNCVVNEGFAEILKKRLRAV